VGAPPNSRASSHSNLTLRVASALGCYRVAEGVRPLETGRTRSTQHQRGGNTQRKIAVRTRREFGAPPRTRIFVDHGP